MNILETLYDAWVESRKYGEDSEEYRTALNKIGNSEENLKLLIEAVSAERIMAFKEGFREATELLIRL